MNSFLRSDIVARLRGRLSVLLCSLVAKCPDCGKPFHQVHKPLTRSQRLWGGWTCGDCGCEIDRYGNKVGSQESTRKKPTLKVLVLLLGLLNVGLVLFFAYGVTCEVIRREEQIAYLRQRLNEPDSDFKKSWANDWESLWVGERKKEIRAVCVLGSLALLAGLNGVTLLRLCTSKNSLPSTDSTLVTPEEGTSISHGTSYVQTTTTSGTTKSVGHSVGVSVSKTSGAN